MMPMHIALVGNPNAGKTSVFNRLTGARQKVANYAGVTVERKSGRFTLPSGRAVEVIDLPGTYSLHSHSVDEHVTQALLTDRLVNERRPDIIVCVVDAANLQRHLQLVLEVRDLGHRVIVLLNMMDSAQRRGVTIDQHMLQNQLKLPVVSAIAVQRGGMDALIAELNVTLDAQSSEPTPIKKEGVSPASPLLTSHLLTNLREPKTLHAEVRAILDKVVCIAPRRYRLDDALDRWFLHPVIGSIVLATMLFLVFQAVYFVGMPATEAIGDFFGMLGDMVSSYLPDGPLSDLVNEALLGGLGTLFGFLPQILVLFFFIQLLEASGYLPRAAFLLDRIMRAVGLSGRSFIPLLSSFACAIPGILSTRSIADPRDRLATMLVAPLMTCSARLPVYALLIAAFIPSQTVMGAFNLQGLVLFALYLAGIAGAILVAWVTKRIRYSAAKKGSHPSETVLLMEMPVYRLPSVRDMALGLWERTRVFLARLTGLILALTVLMWCLTHYPLPPVNAIGPAIDYSFAGYLGRAVQVIFAPLGFNWQITIALIPAFAARETAVAALATVYAAGNELQHQTLTMALTQNISLASALSLMMWFVFAPQCMSTLAVIRRETGGWKWVTLSFVYMFVLAYVASFITYRIANSF